MTNNRRNLCINLPIFILETWREIFVCHRYLVYTQGHQGTSLSAIFSAAIGLGCNIFAMCTNDICWYPQTTSTLCIVGSNTKRVQKECSLISRLINTRKHCWSGYETRLFIALLRPIFMLDMIDVIYPALY